MSVALTGFDEQELLATGAGPMYLAWLLRVFPEETAALLEAGGDPELGPLARGITYLWYTATWSTDVVGAAWAKEHGRTSEDQNLAFGSAYPEALMWKASPGPHPMGAKPTGYGTWAFGPEGT